MTTEGRDERAFEVLRAIRRLIRKVSAHSKALYRDAGLTLPQLLCLKAIGELDAGESEVTVAEVSHAVHLAPATVSRVLDRLERGTLVERERSSKDRRRVCLRLTPAGIDRFHTLPTPLQERFVERFDALPDAERARIHSALEKLLEMMEAGDDPDAAPLLDVRDASSG